jgi:3-hydroxyacyl-[acyl-carrier-protein] dehydratase
MLLNDLFIVDNWQAGNGTLTALLHLRVPHPILYGHFPGRPVLPGACLIQLAEELAASVAGREVRLIRAGPIKFITMIDPTHDGSLAMTLAGKEQAAGEWQITADGFNAGKTFFRFRGVFREAGDYAG